MMKFSTAFLLVFLSSVEFSTSTDFEHDELCFYIPSVLCVREILKTITNETTKLNRTLNQIESGIRSKIKLTETFNRYVQLEITLISSQLPSFDHYQRFFSTNNIDQKQFAQLLAETHDSLSFYFNTIDEILKINEDFPTLIDHLWRKVQTDLGKNGLVCQYRSILQVYSQRWSSIDRAGRIEFVKRGDFDVNSLNYDARSIIVVRLLRDLIRRIHAVFLNLDTKFL